MANSSARHANCTNWLWQTYRPCAAAHYFGSHILCKDPKAFRFVKTLLRGKAIASSFGAVGTAVQVPGVPSSSFETSFPWDRDTWRFYLCCSRTALDVFFLSFRFVRFLRTQNVSSFSANGLWLIATLNRLQIYYPIRYLKRYSICKCYNCFQSK